MKKFLCFMLAVLMLAACLPMSAFAAESATVTVGNKVAKPGDKVTLAFSINKATLANFEITVDFESPLKLVAINAGDFGKIQANLNEGSAKFGKVAFASAANITKKGNLFTATFQVPADIKPGTYAVKAKVHFISDEKLEDLNVSVVNGGITIKCDHNYKLVKTDAATCTAAGTEYYECSICGDSYTTSLKALGHKMGEYKVTTAATCTEAGVKTAKCERCDYTETKAIAAKGHKMGEWKVTTAATCAAEGVETRKCERCDYTETKAIAATGKHTWGEWKVVTAATCTAEGEKVHTCSVCGAEESAKIEKIAHNWTAWYVETEPTCEEPGVEMRACFNCDATETREIKALGHNWVEKITKEPTCGAEGEKTLTCSNCGETKTEIIPATGKHKLATKWSMDAKQHWHECTVCGYKADCGKHDFEWHIVRKATNKVTGLKQYICETCGYVAKEETLPLVEGLDDGPQTGDITGQLVFGAAAALMVLASAAWLVLKRKIAK